MLTQRNLDNAILKGDARYEQFEQRFERQFNEPVEEAQAGMVWHQLPQAVKERMMLADPKLVDELERRFGGE